MKGEDKQSIQKGFWSTLDLIILQNDTVLAYKKSTNFMKAFKKNLITIFFLTSEK